MKRNIENAIAAREAQQENLRIEAENKGKTEAAVRNEWEKLVDDTDKTMEWEYQKEKVKPSAGVA